MSVLGYNKLRANYGSFVVKNITSPPKTICVFNTNIKFGQSKNLLDIPGIGEEDVRISLLKGQVLNKILSGDIQIVKSDVNALSFNQNQSNFLANSNLTTGIKINNTILPYIERRDLTMLGAIDGYNTRFVCPSYYYFTINSSYVLIVYWNGIRQIMNVDFFIDVTSQSPNSHNAYSAIFMAIAPSPGDIIIIDCFMPNTLSTGNYTSSY